MAKRWNDSEAIELAKRAITAYKWDRAYVERAMENARRSEITYWRAVLRGFDLVESVEGQ